MSEFVMNIPAYLERLGLPASMEPTTENLAKLTRAHLEKIPFENLAVHYEHKEPSLAPEDLFEKIIVNKRGGWCFELNKLFFLLLEALGYDCTMVPARIVLNREDVRPISHRATVVRAEGKKWFIDVGYGGQGPKGIVDLSTSEVQHIFGEDFYVTDSDPLYDGEIVIGRIDSGIRRRVVTHREIPWRDVDFAPLNSYYASYPNSPFYVKPILYRCTPEGWVSLVGNTLTECAQGTRQIVELQTKQQVRDVIQQRFALFVDPA